MRKIAHFQIRSRFFVVTYWLLIGKSTILYQNMQNITKKRCAYGDALQGVTNICFQNPCCHEFVYDFWKNRNIPSLFEKVILKNHWEIHWASTGAVGGEGAGLAKLLNKSDIWWLSAKGNRRQCCKMVAFSFRSVNHENENTGFSSLLAFGAWLLKKRCWLLVAFSSLRLAFEMNMLAYSTLRMALKKCFFLAGFFF